MTSLPCSDTRCSMAGPRVPGWLASSSHKKRALLRTIPASAISHSSRAATASAAPCRPAPSMYLRNRRWSENAGSLADLEFSATRPIRSQKCRPIEEDSAPRRKLLLWRVPSRRLKGACPHHPAAAQGLQPSPDCAAAGSDAGCSDYCAPRDDGLCFWRAWMISRPYGEALCTASKPLSIATALLYPRDKQSAGYKKLGFAACGLLLFTETFCIRN